MAASRKLCRIARSEHKTDSLSATSAIEYHKVGPETTKLLDVAVA